MQNPRTRRKVTSLFLGTVFALGAVVTPAVASFLLYPREAHAADELWESVADKPMLQPCGTMWTAGPGMGICTDEFQYKQTIGKIQDNWKYQLMVAAFMGFFDSLTYIAQTMAYDAAEWVAEGGNSQTPMFWEKGYGDYLRGVMLDSVGEFMLTFSEESVLGDLGLNLCAPPNFPELSLEFMLSIPDIAVPGIPRPTPRCPWNQFRDNWKQAASSMRNAEALGNIRGTFTTGGNDIAFGIGAHMALFDAIAENREASILDRLEGNGFRPVTDIITGNITTPSALVEANLNQQYIYGPAQMEQLKWGGVIGNAFQLGFIQLGRITLSTFVNTLVSKLMTKLMKGLFPGSGGGGMGTLPDLLNPAAAPLSATNREEIVAEQFKDIITPRVTSPEEEDVLVEMEACPAAGRTKWNCAISRLFSQALRQGGMTLRQAVDKGFIDETWRMIPSTELKDNQDPSCAERAFCVANLRKLRLARIVPVGWEMAADSPNNQIRCSRSEGCVTLGEVMNGFDDCNYDPNNGGSATGVLDEEHPWCHLIDPNWVLTAMPAQCLMKGFSNSLLGGTAQRAADCQDTVMCLERDADGRCVGGYGYCMAEQTFWQFEAPSCREQFVSCRMFTPRGKNAKPIGYLRSTLDYGTCNETNVGCMWFATRMDASATSTVGWTAEYDSALDKVYFDKNILPCDAAYDGCTDLRRVPAGEFGLNLLRNPSFEYVDGDGNIETWSRGDSNEPYAYEEPDPAEGRAAYAGSKALVAPDGNAALHQVIQAKPGRQYVLSYEVRRYASAVSADNLVRVMFHVAQDDVKAPPNIDEGRMNFGDGFFSEGCRTIVWGNFTGIAAPVPQSAGSEWERVVCSFVAPPQAAWMSVFVHPSDRPALYDALKIEEGEIPTEYGEGLNDALRSVHMRVPPEELSCSGGSGDHPLCDDYARVCRQNEAGCQGYRPKNQPASPEVPAVLTPVDYCPEECVGYAEFRKQPSTFDLVKNPLNAALNDPEDQTVVAFVPSTARVCSARDAGCELFTNMDALAMGGESEQAFSYLRSCEKPGSSAQTFYTWEGAEDTGYQLVTWSMVRDTDAPLPQGPRILVKAGPDGVLKDPDSCNAVTYLLAFDPDCRQFYDPQGNAFYRYESQTILSDTDCAPFRLDRSNRADCEKTGGTYNSEANQCVYMGLASRSNSCDAAVAGCRGYAGTQGNAQMEVFNEDFLGEGYAANAIDGIALSLSEESVLVGDLSLRTEGNGGISFNVPTEPGVFYEVHFWGKHAGADRPEIAVTVRRGNSEHAVGSVVFTNEWNVFRLGTFAGNTAAGATSTVITFNGFTQVNFIDKVRVERVTDVTYAVKDSWNTPAVCDRTSEGIPLPKAMIGCMTYVSRDGQTVNLRQFTRLCRETAIGCMAYVHTENTDSPYAESWERAGTGGATEVTRTRADHYEYYIESADASCPETQDGCRALGQPRFTQDRLALDAEEPFKTVYLRDDASLYDEALCSEPELFCESYAYSAASESGTAYFRAPGEHACEWREGAVVGRDCGLERPELYLNSTFDGWFRAGTDCPCYEERLMRGSEFGIYYTGDPGFNEWRGSDQSLYEPGTYEAWAGTCGEAQAECTEFRDVNDRSDPLHQLGRPYFVINDQRLDRDSCNGQVDPGNGCVLFRDMSDTRLPYSALATEYAYEERGYKPVDPVDCESRPDHPSCVAALQTAKEQEAERVYRSVYKAVYDAVIASGQSSAAAAVNAHTQAAQARDQVLNGPFQLRNDTNVVVKVKPDRACSQWLACETGETVYDPQEGVFKSICSELALCNEQSRAEESGVPYCTSFVNRSAESAETILKRYRVIDAKTYADRPVGFGAVDYSGFTMPDKFQVVDASLEPVGSYISDDPAAKSKYKKDYRLGIAIDVQAFPSLVDPNPPAQALEVMANTPEFKRYACVFNQTGAIGLMTAGDELSENGNICWLSLDQGLPPRLAGTASTAMVTDNLNAANLAGRFAQDEFPELDQTLSRSFPDTQCKAAPESNAPFGNAFIIEWDDSVRPPEPSRAIEGYGNANFCEYGEDCSCVYKKVSYGGYTKYYEPLSTDVVNAVCAGGYRDGLPCIPNSGIEGSQEVTVNVTSAAQGEEEEGGTSASVSVSAASVEDDARCGEGGVCTPISDVTLVRGITGQCLEYDMARVRAGDQTQNECLAWNPNPVMTGPGDQYHWHPTAGFQPPQSSGRYYCSSAVRDPRTQQFRPVSWVPKDIPDEGFDWETVALSALPGGVAGLSLDALSSGRDVWAWGSPTYVGGQSDCGDGKLRCYDAIGPLMNSEGNYAGRIKALFYADWFASDGNCTNFLAWGGCTGNEPGASLDGHRAEGTKMGDRCEQIDDEKGMSQEVIKEVMRLVTTGQGTNRSYAEYAILFNPWHTAYSALGFIPADWDTAFDYSLEDAIANFEFSAPEDKIGCAYSEEWADVSVDDYDADKDKGWGSVDNQWHANFRRFLQQGGNSLNRSTAKIVTEDGSPSGIPVKVECLVQAGDGGASADLRGGDEGLCFIKTWELNYRAQGKQKFQAFGPDIGRNDMDHLSRRPVYGRCDSSDHWFSIRAVFEDTNPSENSKDAEDVNPDQLVGPFQFVGLWVTACAPGNETKYIYLDMKMNSADICRELLETISKDSHESAAFTDRNSRDGGFSMDNGFNWYTSNIPYGASLATGDAGKQPLFMTGVRQQDVNPMNPPIFTYPGQTYFSSAAYPASNWGRLSNVFAKIYRIYGYDARVVTSQDFACTDSRSPQFGQWCPPVDGMNDPEDWVPAEHDGMSYEQYVSSKYCGFQGTCLRGGIKPADVFSQKVCNSFSGVNRGLDCSSNPDICHEAAMEDRNGVLVPLLGACELFQGYDSGDDRESVDQRWEELTSGRFRCQGADCGPECEGTANSGNMTGCTRAQAVREGAFRCAVGTVRGPDKVRQTIGSHVTYASYCTRESSQSNECPIEIESGVCNKEAYPLHGGAQWIPPGTIGTCEGRPWAQCTDNSDCSFTARNFWPSGSVNEYFLWSQFDDARLGQHSQRLDGEEPWGSGYGEGFAYWIEPSDNWFYANEDGQLAQGDEVRIHETELLAAFWPAMPWFAGMDCRIEDGACFFGTRIASAGTIATYDVWDDTDQLKLYPGFVPSVTWRPGSSNFGSNFRFAGHPLSASVKEAPGGDAGDSNDDIPPYIQYDMTADYEDHKGEMWAHYGACESVALMWREGGDCQDGTCVEGDRQGQSCQADSDCMGGGSVMGTCRGGGRDGEPCGSDEDCQPEGISSTLLEDSRNWCNPVTTVGTACWTEGNGSDTTNPRHPFNEPDESLDNNMCTHPAGYWPKPQYCEDPNDEYCGLFGYDLESKSQSVRDDVPLPTDVTPGFYTPLYLNPGGDNVSQNALDYKYVSYYNPEPPHVAAPDMRTCRGNQCRVTGLGTFAVDGLAGGVVNGGTGNHVATMRFYAWAAHDQMPMRRIIIDWGDGSISEIPDGYMKNRKPYCQTPKECSETPGLTCETDADCPPGGGLCVSFGSCSNAPNVTCSNDRQCIIGGEEGFCETRVRFGNDQDACDENFFEFRHAYSCMPETVSQLERCDAAGGLNRCSGDNDVACPASACAAGDSCVYDVMAPPSDPAAETGGCFDTVNNRCMFTPRIMVIDNWGWCSGECRSAVHPQSGKLIDGANAPILHPNGGCFDASGIRSNVSSSIIGPNECSVDRDERGAASARPWVVFPGAVQLLPGQEL